MWVSRRIDGISGLKSVNVLPNLPKHQWPTLLDSPDSGPSGGIQTQRIYSPIRCAVENDRKHDDLCIGAMGYKTSWPTMNG